MLIDSPATANDSDDVQLNKLRQWSAIRPSNRITGRMHTSSRFPVSGPNFFSVLARGVRDHRTCEL